MILKNRNASIYTQLSNKYHIPYPVVEVICNHPFMFANRKISDDDDLKTIMFGYLFKIKPKKKYEEERRKKKKYSISLFQNLYPINLYVAKLDDWNDVVEIFNFYRTTTDLRRAENEVKVERPGNIGGVTYLVREKDTGVVGVLILLGDSQCSTLAHESIHYADAVYDYLYMNGEGYDQGNEQYAYLVTWCVDQLDEFLQYRNKQKKAK